MELDTTLPSLDNYRVGIGTKNSFLIRTNLIPTIECQLFFFYWTLHVTALIHNYYIQNHYYIQN